MVGLVCKSTGGGSTCPAPGERGEPPALLGTLFDEGQPLGVILECSAEPGPDATTIGARIVSQNNGSSYLGMGSVQTSSAPASGGVRSASSGSCCGGGSDSAECGGPPTRVYVSAAAPSEVVCTGTTTPNAAPCGGIFGEFEWARAVWHEEGEHGEAAGGCGNTFAEVTPQDCSAEEKASPRSAPVRVRGSKLERGLESVWISPSAHGAELRGSSYAVEVPGAYYKDDFLESAQSFPPREQALKGSIAVSGVSAAEEGVWGCERRGVKAKKMRFAENIIWSVSFVETDDEVQVVLESSYPSLVLVGLLIGVTLFALHWCIVSVVAGDRVGTERIAAVFIISFMSTGLVSLVLLVLLGVSWRPDCVEIGAFTSSTGVLRCSCVIFSGSTAFVLLVVSLALFNSPPDLACFYCCPFVITYLYELLKGHCVSSLTTVACVFVVGAIVCFATGDYVGSADGGLECLWPTVISVGGGAAMSLYLFQLRTASREVHTVFLMFSTLLLTSALLVVISYAAGGLTQSADPAGLPLYVDIMGDFPTILLCGILMLLYHLLCYWGFPYLNRLSLSGIFVLGGPVSLVCFNFLVAPVSLWVYALAGGVLTMAGCIWVLIGDWYLHQTDGVVYIGLA